MKNLLLKLFAIILLAGFFHACNETLVEEQQPVDDLELKSARNQQSEISQTINNRYIVVFKKHVRNPKSAAAGLKSQFGIETGHIYEHALKGFSAYIPENAIKGLQNNPNIEIIESDITMKAFQQTVPTGIKRIEAHLNPVAAINGDGGNVDVDVAILDTGVDDDHPDLNVADGVRFYTINTGPPSSRGANQDNNYDDDNGHGTHVAGTVAALDNDLGVVGVAPGARIWAVKILDSGGSGYLSDIIAGIDWVTARAETIEVINMSIGGQGFSNTYQEAIQGAVNAGVVVVVAAGNESMDVYGPDGSFGTSDDIIPAAYPEVAAISALADSDGEPGGLGGDTSYDPDDSFAGSFSNYSHNVVSGNPVISPGKAIDLMLPGVDITSTYLDGQYATVSGTSMASPHAAGLAALYIAQNGRAGNATEVYAIRQALIDGGVAQRDANGLVNFNDPDGNEENLGWAGTNQTTTGSIAGTVTDGFDAIAGASIVVDNTSFSATSDAEGNYTINDIPTGTYSVTASASGFSSSNVTDVSVSENIITTVNFSLTSVQTYTVSGTVTDGSTALEGALVEIEGTELEATTNADGYYSISNVEAGDYTITASISGYESGNKTITLVNSDLNVDFSLTEISSGGITLTATDSKVRGVRYVTLEWSGASGEQVNILINGSPFEGNPLENDGYEQLDFGRTSGTFTFQVCETDGSDCSNETTVTI